MAPSIPGWNTSGMKGVCPIIPRLTRSRPNKPQCTLLRGRWSVEGSTAIDGPHPFRAPSRRPEHLGNGWRGFYVSPVVPEQDASRAAPRTWPNSPTQRLLARPAPSPAIPARLQHHLLRQTRLLQLPAQLPHALIAAEFQIHPRQPAQRR